MKNWTVTRRQVTWPSRYGVVGDALRVVFGVLRVHHARTPTYGLHLDWWGTVRGPHSKLTGIGICWGEKGLLWLWPIQFVRKGA